MSADEYNKNRKPDPTPSFTVTRQPAGSMADDEDYHTTMGGPGKAPTTLVNEDDQLKDMYSLSPNQLRKYIKK